MSIIRDFVTKLPAACGVPNDPVTFTWVDKDGVEHTETKGLADIFGEHNAKLFGFELANPDGPLNRKNFEDVWPRIRLGIDPWAHFCDYRASSFACQILVFASKTIDANGGEWEGKKAMRDNLDYHSAHPWNQSVSTLMTVEQASTLGNWA